MSSFSSLFPQTKYKANSFIANPAGQTRTATIQGGYYIFEHNDRGTIPILKINQGEKVIISGVSFTSNSNDADFTSNLIGIAELQLYHGKTGSRILLNPFLFTSFQQGQNFTEFFKPVETENTFTEDVYFSIKAKVLQIGSKADLSITPIFNFIRTQVNL